MNDKEELLKMYLVNEGLRLDRALESARYAAIHKTSDTRLYEYLAVLQSKTEFDRVMQTVCRILNI